MHRFTRLGRRHLLLAATLLPSAVVAADFVWIVLDGWGVHQVRWDVLNDALLWWLDGYEPAAFGLTSVALLVTFALWLPYLVDVGSRTGLGGAQRAVWTAIVLVLPVPGMLAYWVAHLRRSGQPA